MERWREQLYLEHSAKGSIWGKHKYIAIKNGRYIYPEDLKKKVANKFQRLKGRYEELRYLKPNYEQHTGYDKSTSGRSGEYAGYYRNETGNPGSDLERGLKAGRKRVTVEATEKRIRKGLEAARIRKLSEARGPKEVERRNESYREKKNAERAKKEEPRRNKAYKDREKRLKPYKVKVKGKIKKSTGSMPRQYRWDDTRR